MLFSPSQAPRNRWSRLLMASWAAVFIVAGCDCEEQLDALEAELKVTPATLDFGPVSLGSEFVMNVQLTNVGRGALLLDAVTLETAFGSELSLMSVATTDCEGRPRGEEAMRIASGACARVTVRYKPEATHDVTGSIVVAARRQKGNVTVPVTGKGVSPQLRVCVLADGGDLCTDLASAPPVIPTIDFGQVPWGSPVPRYIRIENKGGVELDVVSVTTESLYGGQLAVQAEGGEFTARIAPGKEDQFPVVFTPQGDGERLGTLRIVTNDLKTPLLQLPIVAFAIGPKLCLKEAVEGAEPQPVNAASISFDGRDPSQPAGFGVPIGKKRSIQLLLENCGQVDFALTGLDLKEKAEPPAPFALQAPRKLPYPMPVGATLTVPLVFAPPAQSPFLADNKRQPYVNSILYRYDVFGQELKGTVALTGTGERADCEGTVKPVAAIAVPGGLAAYPGQVVEVDGSFSAVRSGRGLARYQWKVFAGATPGASVDLTTATPVASSELTNSPVWSWEAGAEGDYVFQLTVSDDYACSTQEQVLVRVRHRTVLRVKLVWPEQYGDVDIHVIKPGGELLDDKSDCHWANCVSNLAGSSASSNLDWPPLTSSDGNPTINQDSYWAKPETFVMENTSLPGDYRVVINYQCARERLPNGSYGPDKGEVRPSVRVETESNGTVQNVDYPGPSMKQGNQWSVATVSILPPQAEGGPLSFSLSPPPASSNVDCGPGTADCERVDICSN